MKINKHQIMLLAVLISGHVSAKVTYEDALNSNQAYEDELNALYNPNTSGLGPYEANPTASSSSAETGAGKVNNGGYFTVKSGAAGKVSWSVSGDYPTTYGVCRVRLIVNTPTGTVQSPDSYGTENDGGQRRNSANPSTAGTMSGLSPNTQYSIRATYSAVTHAWGCRGVANPITYQWTGV
ncbi:hypothetical protein DZ860_21135 [Vibrio sinensis]|uniref:Fibronectin type-III domain-containing protein n=1 Tax=Vibrio sinensis TaxID=2302434 RepID=A0A3A6Q638_9VIBR|nr:hypothetical protein [Vibrio sinensis]RJX65866.1 hypothetical protein DZ860_21135 [Vibrio sinensis]